MQVGALTVALVAAVLVAAPALPWPAAAASLHSGVAEPLSLLALSAGLFVVAGVAARRRN